MNDEKPEKPHIWWSRNLHRPLMWPPDKMWPRPPVVSEDDSLRFITWRAGIRSRGYVGWPHPGPED